MFTPLWLDYEKQKSTIKIKNLETSKESKLVQKAIEELELASCMNSKEGYELFLDWPCNAIEEEEGFSIKRDNQKVHIQAKTDKGILYAVMRLIRHLRIGESIDNLCDAPRIPLRILNHWDNMDGSIERGYSGQSFFFANEEIICDERTVHYARLLTSIGINALVFNNVNVVGPATELITSRYYEDLNRLFSVFADYGIKTYLSLNFASPIQLGGLDNCDPLDEEVIAWWEEKMEEVFGHLPQLGGFLVKADSEGRPGPFTYGRNQAEGANMLGKILAKHDASLIWRAFVYNCRQDWRDHSTDRARAAYDYFSPLDGQFEENVYLQIKNGPMDFQVLEPVSPLFFAMPKTNLIVEFQVAQEYTGQQIDLCYLLPMWREILDFPGDLDNAIDPVKARILKGKSAIAAVANTGNDANWCGHYLAAANFYGFGELAWNPDADSRKVAEDFLKQSFALADEKLKSISDMMMESWTVMEKYTAPLGIGWMVTPHYHYAPNIDGYEYSMWGTYHRADHKGIGIDRSQSGTQYAYTYPESIGNIYGDISTCPDELLLFFHHVPYTHVLHSGKTVIQHIYDTHFEGYLACERFLETWIAMEGKVDEEIYFHTKERFTRQLANAKEWCDQINTYFYRKSGIADEKGRKIYT